MKPTHAQPTPGESVSRTLRMKGVGQVVVSRCHEVETLVLPLERAKEHLTEHPLRHPPVRRLRGSELPSSAN
jgi:hypothetical protein